jgi:uncharacterized protein YunC (DUF1805 family)
MRGYFSLNSANILSDIAVSEDVRAFNDVLNACVAAISSKAGELGVKAGMTE